MKKRVLSVLLLWLISTVVLLAESSINVDSEQKELFSTIDIKSSTISKDKDIVTLNAIQDKKNLVSVKIQKNIIGTGYSYYKIIDTKKQKNLVNIVAFIRGEKYIFIKGKSFFRLYASKIDITKKQISLRVCAFLCNTKNHNNIADISFTISVDNDGFDMLYKKQMPNVKARSEQFLNRKIEVTIKTTIKNKRGIITVKGTTNLPNNTKLFVYVSNDIYHASDEIAVVDGKFISSGFRDNENPLFNGKYGVSIRSKSYDKQPRDVQNLIGKYGKNLTGKFIKKDEYSSNNELELIYEKSFKIKDSVDRKEIVSITSKNIKKVIKSLKKNYGIKATAFMNDKLNKYKMCWNDRACEIYADKVQIQGIYKTVEALTSSKVSPKYYQKVCSAIMIGLTGANKKLIEQQMPQYFNYASQNGRSRWETLGIEITISPDSSGLLGCSFYKR